MRIHALLPLAGILTCFGIACTPQQPAEKPAAFNTTVTIREIMQSMVAPEADVLWNAVSSSVTDKGVEEKAPKNDEEWARVRHEAITLAEATNLILMSGRHVAKPGEKAEDPKVQLSPEQIEALINQDKESWTKFSHGLRDATMVAVQAIDAKNAEALSNAGDGIDKACETCHLKYWYPNEAKQGQKQ